MPNRSSDHSTEALTDRVTDRSTDDNRVADPTGSSVTRTDGRNGLTKNNSTTSDRSSNASPAGGLEEIHHSLPQTAGQASSPVGPSGVSGPVDGRSVAEIRADLALYLDASQRYETALIRTLNATADALAGPVNEHVRNWALSLSETAARGGDGCQHESTFAAILRCPDCWAALHLHEIYPQPARHPKEPK